MIPVGVQVFLALEPIDLRCGFERLAGLALERVGYDVRSGALFVFVGRRGHAAKVLFHDGSGLCLVHKRLDRGLFQVPRALAEGVTHLELDEGAFEALFDGLPITPEGAVDRPPRARVH